MKKITAQIILKTQNLKLLIMFLVLSIQFLVIPSAYAATATLTLSPSTGTFNKGCNFSVDIVINTGGAATEGTDVILFYDPSRLKATSITPGTIYADYPGSAIDEANSKIKVAGLASVSSAFSGTGTVATVNFTVLPTAPMDTATQLKFDFDVSNKTSTTDSNVAQISSPGTITDILDSVTNGSYNIGEGVCSGAVVDPKKPVGAVSDGTIVNQTQKKTVDQIVGGKPGISLPTEILGVLGGALVIIGVLGMMLI